MKSTSIALTAVCLFVYGLIAIDLPTHEAWGIALIEYLQPYRTAFRDAVFSCMSWAGAELFLLLVPLFAWSADGSRGIDEARPGSSRDGKALRRRWVEGHHVLAMEFAVLLNLSFYLQSLLKLLHARPRPFVHHDVTTAVSQNTMAEAFSFPSGHALGSCASWLFVARRTRLTRPLAMALVAGISVSRVWVVVHYPHDVIAGFCLGLVLVELFQHYLSPRAYIGHWSSGHAYYHNWTVWKPLFVTAIAMFAMNVLLWNQITTRAVSGLQMAPAIFLCVIVCNCFLMHPWDAKPGLFASVIRFMIGAPPIAVLYFFNVSQLHAAKAAALKQGANFAGVHVDMSAILWLQAGAVVATLWQWWLAPRIFVALGLGRKARHDRIIEATFREHDNAPGATNGADAVSEHED